MAPWPHGKFRAALLPQGRINAAPTGARRGAIYGALAAREIPGRVITPRAALMRPLRDGGVFRRGAIYGALAAREIPGCVIPPGPH